MSGDRGWRRDSNLLVSMQVSIIILILRAESPILEILDAMDRSIRRAMMAYVLFANMKQLEFYGRFIFLIKGLFQENV